MLFVFGVCVLLSVLIVYTLQGVVIGVSVCTKCANGIYPPWGNTWYTAYPDESQWVIYIIYDLMNLV